MIAGGDIRAHVAYLIPQFQRVGEPEVHHETFLFQLIDQILRRAFQCRGATVAAQCDGLGDDLLCQSAADEADPHVRMELFQTTEHGLVKTREDHAASCEMTFGGRVELVQIGVHPFRTVVFSIACLHLQFEIESFQIVKEREKFIRRGDLLIRVFQLHALDLRQCEFLHQTGAGGGALYVAVMHHDDFAVGRQAEIRLKAGNAVFDGVFEG